MKFFSYDGLLAQIIRYIAGMFVLNLCFLLCCLPVFTIGSSVTAMYSVFLNTADQSPMYRRFFRAFRDNFRQATAMWLILLGIGVLMGLDWYILLSYSFVGSSMMQVAAVVLSVAYLALVGYVFALQARFENTMGATLKNALILTFGSPIVSLLLVLVTAFPVLIFFVDLQVFLHVVAIWIPLGFALQLQIHALLLHRLFRKLQPD